MRREPLGKTGWSAGAAATQVTSRFGSGGIDAWQLRYAAVIATFGLLVLILFRDEILGPVVYPLQLLTADITHALVQRVGIEAVREGVVLLHPGGFAYAISHGCAALVPVGFFSVSVLAYPASNRLKVLGLLGGVPILVVLNFTRLVHLFYLGAYRPDQFHLAHGVVWQTVTIFTIVALWWIWTCRARS